MHLGVGSFGGVTDGFGEEEVSRLMSSNTYGKSYSWQKVKKKEG